MKFFTTSTGTELEQKTIFEEGGFQPLIEEGEVLLCAIAGATWEPATDFKERSVRIKLHVIEPGQYKDFVVNDNVKVFDPIQTKRDKALAKLMTYDTLCKGLLLKADKAGKDIIGDNELLARALNGGEVTATFAIWEMTSRDGKEMTGNWVKAIAAKPKKLQEEDKEIMKKAKSQPESSDYDDNFNDPIPF